MTCPHCSNEVGETDLVCPSCGGQLDAASDPEVIEATPATATSRKPWMVGVGVGALILAVGAVSFALFGNDVAAPFADRLPGDADAYFSLDVAELTSEGTKEVIAEFGGLIEKTTGEEFDVDTVVQDLLDELEDELGSDISYDDDIASWASGTLAGAAYASEDMFDQSLAFWVSGRDEAALAQFIDKMESVAVDQGFETTRIAVGGIDFVAADAMESMLVGQVGTDLLVVTDRELAAEVLAATAENSLASDEAFTGPLGKLPPNAIATFATSASQDGLFSLGSMAATGVFGAAPVAGQSDADSGWFAGSVTVASGNIRFDSVSAADPDFELSEDSPALAELPGEDIVLFARLAGIVPGLEALADSFGAGDGVTFGSELGLDDILGLIKVDAALAVWPSSEPEIPVGAGFVGVGEGDAGSVVSSLQSMLFESGAPVTEVPGGFVFQNLVAFGTRGPLTIVATDRALLSGSPDQNVTTSATYEKVGDLLGGGFIPTFGADVDAVLGLIDGFVDDPEVLEYFACNPVRFIAAGTRTENGLSTTASIIEIEAPEACN